MLNIKIELIGKGALLQHNGRLANPLDPLTIQVHQIAKKRPLTNEDYRKLLPLEAYAGTWETEDGYLGLPTENVKASLVSAATAFKQGKAIKSALLFDPTSVAPLWINNQQINAHEFAYNAENLFIRTVVISGRRTLRARVIVRHWRCVHSFSLLDDVINPQDLEKILIRAGRLVGVGDWRPLYGTFTTRVLSTEVAEEDAAA